MKKLIYQSIACVFITLFSVLKMNAQSTSTIVSGIITNHTKDGLSAVSVTIKGSSAGTFTDDKGRFKFTTTQKPPFTIIISSIGYIKKEVSFTGDPLSLEMDVSFALGEEVVVAASRVPERILESPVSIERISSAAIQQSPATNYYDMVGNLKGVDIITSSLTFKTPGTRGFNSSGNLRLNQIMDGMDNQAPGLNFSVGSVIGLTELDVDNVELLAGASSALYGSGGMNGTLLINSKNPFKYQGLSFQIKQGVNHIDNSQRNHAPFYDWSLRFADKINEKLAYKIGVSFTQAHDWLGNNKSDFLTGAGGDRSVGKSIAGDRYTDPNYDGVNVYGDETNTATANTTFKSIATLVGQGFIAAGVPAAAINGIISTIPASQHVSRTGYDEKDVISPNTLNTKLTGALHYKINDNVEASLVANYGMGNTVYTGLGRYSLKNFKIGQYKAEIKAKNWHIRAYATQEDAGDSYNASVATQYFNEAVKPSLTWFQQYTQAYLQARLTGNNDINSHNAARAFADAGRPTGNLLDNPIFQKVTSTPISKGGGLFVDKTALYVADAQYNLTDLLNLAPTGFELLVGGNIKQYQLNSQGTLFADTTGKIKINESGAYAQLGKKLFNDVLKLTFSGRYDKNQNFDGRFTPRATAVVKLAKDNNLRFSYQQAYRFPSTQNQWINLQVGSNTFLIGGLPAFRDYYHFNTNAPYTAASFATGNPASFVKATFGQFKPETATSYEIGYKAVLAKKLLIDVYAYTSSFDNFIGATNVVQITNPALLKYTVYQVSTNSTGKVTTNGFGLSLDYLLPNNFTVGGNFYSDDITQAPDNFVTYFNTPKYRSNITVGNTAFGYQKRVSANLVYRWQDSFYYQGTFGAGDMSAFGTIDAQVSYKFPHIKSAVKLGATNLLNQYYLNAFGNAQVGGLYYVSFGYNIF